MQKVFKVLGVVLIGFVYSHMAYASTMATLYSYNTLGNDTFRINTGTGAVKWVSFQPTSNYTFSDFVPHMTLDVGTTVTGGTWNVDVYNSSDGYTLGSLIATSNTLNMNTVSTNCYNTCFTATSSPAFRFLNNITFTSGQKYVFEINYTGFTATGGAQVLSQLYTTGTAQGKSLKSGTPAGSAYMYLNLFTPSDGIDSAPLPSGLYPNNPVTFSGTYSNGITAPYDEIVFDLHNTTQSFQSALVKPTNFTSGSGITYSFAQSLPLQGNYTYNVRLWSSTNATGTPWYTGSSFSLATTTATSTAIFEATKLVCDTWDISCYFQKAFIWLIYPSDSLVTSYSAFLATLQSKPPIGYFTLITAQINGLNASSTPIVSVAIPITLKSVFFTPFDIAVASILWFWLALQLYKRLTHVTI